MCNLSNVNMMAFVDICGNYSLSQLRDAMSLATRVALRTTCVDLEFPEWDSQQKRDRLLGVGLSGVFDFMDATGISKKDFAVLLEALRDEIVESAESYAKELGIPVPILSTTIKPSGTSSQLFGESSGAHRSHSQYFIRRVRVSANDPLVKVCEELGYKVLPEVGQTEQNCTTKVVEFYAESRAKRFKGDVSAIEQLQDYMFLQKHFTQHNTSITIHVKDNEWAETEQFIFDNWDEFVAVSFISYDDSFYQLLPYESITGIEYIEGLEKLKPFNQGLLAKFENGEDFEIDGADCVSGMCPIK